MEEENAYSGQYLTFTLGNELFGIDVTQVREVLDYSEITKIPQTPDFLRGVINVRGSIIPVVDMHLKFGMGKTEKGQGTCIIVTEIKIEDENVIISALADSVQEVIELESDQIEHSPKLGMKFRSEFLNGIGKRRERFIMLLNLERIFSSEELCQAEEVKVTEEEIK